MTYTALSPVGPRIAVAASSERRWERPGLVRFAGEKTTQLEDGVDNKDAVLFPSLLTDPRTGRPAIALLHRPTVAGSRDVFVEPWWSPPAKAADARSAGQIKHPRVWISYSNGFERLDDLCSFQSHHRLLSPRQSWEGVKVGGGAPPLLTAHGWLLVYHGVGHRSDHFRHSAGAVLLDPDNPQRVLYRSSSPILSPGVDDQGRHTERRLSHGN